MFDKLGFGEILLIVGAVLLIFGPSKLPQLGKSVGQGIREFKKSIKGITEEDEPKADQDKTQG